MINFDSDWYRTFLKLHIKFQYFELLLQPSCLLRVSHTSSPIDKNQLIDFLDLDDLAMEVSNLGHVYLALVFGAPLLALFASGLCK